MASKRKHSELSAFPEGSLSASGSLPTLISPEITLPSPSKRRKTKKGSDEPLEEKRLARYKPKCPQSILERVERVMSQRFFLIDREREGQEFREKFMVLGSTGNVYDVFVDKIPTCSCPDATKGNHCKHILFVFLKVLSVPTTSPHYYQKALLTSELEETFRAAPPNPTINASQRVKDAYATVIGSPSKASSSTIKPENSDTNKGRKNPNGEDCPICYEAMEGDEAMLDTLLVWCETCSNAVHNQCFGQWSQTAKMKGDKLTCVYCRAVWPVSTASGSKGGMTISEDGYVNLGSIAGISTERDTSSYYDGPRRGYSSWQNSRRRYY